MLLQPERGVFQHTAVHTMHSSWTYQCPPLSPIHLFCKWKMSIWRLHMMTYDGNCLYISWWLLWLWMYFLNSSWFILLCDGLNIQGSWQWKLHGFTFWMINDITEALGILLYCDTECGSPANITIGKKINKLVYKGYNNFILCTTLACFSTFHLPTMVPKFRALVSIQ